MLYALWGLLNLGLLVVFIGICFRTAKLVRENLGLLASIVFIFGLLGFAGNSGNRNEATDRVNNQVKKWAFTSEKEIVPGTRKYVLINMDKTWLSTVDLGVAYGREKTSPKLVPIETNSTTSGFVSGHRWKPNVITVNTTARSGKLVYHVDGLLEWNLLGVTIYTQFKTYSGSINIEIKQ